MKITNQLHIHRGGGDTTKQAAFTLIELLVVIAIIGILAGVVLASLNSARNKGRIASIKSNLRNAVSQSNIYFNENGTYAGFCDDPTIVSILSALGGAGNAACYVHANTIQNIDWGVAATYDGVHFTADPSGVLQLDLANTGGSQTWDTAMLSCPAIGKRMSGNSSLKALYNITNNTPYDFVPYIYWSSTPNPANLTTAFAVHMGDGGFGPPTKSQLHHVRCGS